MAMMMTTTAAATTMMVMMVMMVMMLLGMTFVESFKISNVTVLVPAYPLPKQEQLQLAQTSFRNNPVINLVKL